MPLFVLRCGGTKANPDLSHDILGISVGINKDDAERHLKETGKLIREDETRQQVWVLKENPTFGHLGIGYDRENRVEFVTAFAKTEDGKPMKYEEVGDLVAKKEPSARIIANQECFNGERCGLFRYRTGGRDGLFVYADYL